MDTSEKTIFDDVEQDESQENPVTEAPEPAANPDVEKKANLILKKLVQTGKMVRLHIGGWSARKKLKPEDLGLDFTDVPLEIISLGQKRLIKKSSFAGIVSVRNKAYSIVEQYSTESWIPGIRYMTEKSFGHVISELTKLKVEYFEAVDGLVAQYPKLKLQMLEEFPEFAKALEPFYPSQEAVRQTFKFAVHEFTVTMVTQAAKVLKEAQVEIKGNLMTELNGFIKGAVQETRKDFLEELGSMKDKLLKEGKVHGKTIKRIEKMIESARKKDFANDAEFLNLLDSFRKKYLSKETLSDKVMQKEVAGRLDEIIHLADSAESVEEVVDGYRRSILA